MASADSGRLVQDPSRQVVALSEKLYAAQSSWHEAEAARKAAKEESEAVQRALQTLKHEHMLAPSPVTSNAVAIEEKQLRDRLNALEMARREAIQREAHEDNLKKEAARLAREVEERERESQVRLAKMETAEAQRDAAAALQSVAELESRTRLQSSPPAQLAQHHYTALHEQQMQDSPRSQQQMQAAPVSPQSARAMTASEEARVDQNSAAGPTSTAVMPGYASGSVAESDALMSMLELHTKLEETQSKLKAQVRLTFSLQDKLRRQEDAMREAQSAEHRARADCSRHMERRKQEQESRTRSEQKLTKRAELAERKVTELETMNEALREQLTSSRQAQASAERRAAIAEDDLGPVSKGELRRAQYELAEEKRKRREQERSFNAVLAAEQRAHAALKQEQAAAHESRKVSLRHAQRAKTAAQEKLAFEKSRTAQLEEELTKAHEEKMRKAAEARGRIANIEVASTYPSQLYAQSFPSSRARSPPRTLESPSEAAKAAVAMTSAAMAEVIAAKTTPVPVVRPTSPRPASPRRPQASPLVNSSIAQVNDNARSEPGREETTDWAVKELGQVGQRAAEARHHPSQSYVHHGDVGSHAVVAPSPNSATNLFDKPTAGYAAATSAMIAKKSLEEGSRQLRNDLANSMTRMGELFKAWDRDGSRTISKVEFRLAIERLGLTFPESVCNKVFKESAFGAESIDYHKFIHHMLKDDLRREIDHVMETFKRLDANSSGGVSREEFRKGIQVIGLDASPHDVDVIFDDIDRDQNGRIEFSELWAHLHKPDTRKLGMHTTRTPAPVNIGAPNPTGINPPTTPENSAVTPLYSWHSGALSATDRRAKAVQTHVLRMADTREVRAAREADPASAPVPLSSSLPPGARFPR